MENTQIDEEKALIEKLKKQYGKITTVIVPLDEDDASKVATYYLKKPGRTERMMISKLAKGEVQERAVIAGFNALRVAGDEVAILERPDHYEALLAAQEALVQILDFQRATIKKN